MNALKINVVTVLLVLLKKIFPYLIVAYCCMNCMVNLECTFVMHAEIHAYLCHGATVGNGKRSGVYGHLNQRLGETTIKFKS